MECINCHIDYDTTRLPFFEVEYKDLEKKEDKHLIVIKKQIFCGTCLRNWLTTRLYDIISIERIFS